VLAHALDTRGRLTQSYGSQGLDAALLMLPLVRFLPPDDPRLRATILAIADELTEDGLVLRYRTDTTDDGLDGDEGSFLACSFWLVSALAEIGETERARALCERLLAAASPRGLYAEELAPRTAPRQLPPGPHPPHPDQRRPPHHPRPTTGLRRRDGVLTSQTPPPRQQRACGYSCCHSRLNCSSMLFGTAGAVPSRP
jgi:hypothetical protein